MLKCLVSDIGRLPGSGIRVWIKYSSHTECGPEVHEKMKIKIKRRRSRKVDQPNFNQVRFITFIGPFPELFDYTCSSITWPKCTQEDRKWNCCDKHHSSVQLHRASQHHYLFSVIQCNSAILLPPLTIPVYTLCLFTFPASISLLSPGQQ